MSLGKTIVFALILAIPQTLFAEGLNRDNSGKAKTADVEWIGARGDLPSAALSPDDVCWGGWQGTLAGVKNNWYWGGEYYAAYQDPAEVGCIDTYPFNVTDVQFTVLNPAGDAGDLTIPMQAIIYSVDLSNPTCPKPGVVIGRGSMTPVFIPDDSWKVAQLTVDVCVNGPYFAGVYCPESIGDHTLDIGMADPATTPFGLRTCAAYNNYRGWWEDLVTSPNNWVGNLDLKSGGYSANENSCTECPEVIAPGYDLWQSSRDGRIVMDLVMFNIGIPLPPDFFGPGSDPFDQPISDLQGQPVETNPSGVLGLTDMIIRRLDPIIVPAPGDPPQTVDIEIVALNLAASTPVMVTYNGGQNPEGWFVRICLSNTSPSTGSMDIESWCCNGGTWNWHPLNVKPQFIFSRVSDGLEVVFDAPANSYPGFLLDTFEGRWSAAIDPPPIPGMVVSPGIVSVDHDCDPGTSNIELGQSSRFVLTGGLGEPWFPEPCDEDYCPVSNATGDEYISRVEIGSIDNVTGGSSYSDYYSTHATTMTAGVGHPFTITGMNTWGGDRWNMWIDWNNDFDFYDAGEEIGEVAGSGPYTGTITPPYGSEGGSYRLRVRMNTGSAEPCGAETGDGETEDYRIDVLQSLCSASGYCDDDVYISYVELYDGTPIGYSGCGHYSDFFEATPIPYTTTPTLLGVYSEGYSGAYIGAWIDWNQDNDFDDGGEQCFVGNQGNSGSHFVSIAKPPGTPSGEYRLRFAIDVYGIPGPCDDVSGEVEDYKVVVSGCCEGRVGDANNLGGDEPTIGDVSVLIDAKFITGTCLGILECLTEADVNQTGGSDPDCDDISIGDISTLIDYLYITGTSLGLPNCL